MIGNIISSFGNLLGVGFNNQTQMDIANKNWERQLEFWKMQNEYNTPKAQMGRYAAAGLNPNLIYGSGTASAGNASGSPTPQMPNLQPYRLDNLANVDNWLLQEKSVNAEVRNKESLSRYNDSKTITEAIKQIGYRIDNEKNEEERDRLIRLRDSYDEQLRYSVDKIAAEAQRTENENTLFDLTMDARVKQYFKQNDLTVAQTQVAMATVKRLHAATTLDWKRCAKVGEEIALLSEDIAYRKRENRFGDDTYQQRVDRYSQELTNIILSGDSKKLDNYLRGRGFDDFLVKKLRGFLNMATQRSDLPKAQNYYNPEFYEY